MVAKKLDEARPVITRCNDANAANPSRRELLTRASKVAASRGIAALLGNMETFPRKVIWNASITYELLDSVTPARTALLVIDMPRDFLLPEGYPTQAGLDIEPLVATIRPIGKLLAVEQKAGLLIVHAREDHVPDLSDSPPYKLERSHRAGAEIGSKGPLGRLLVRGEVGRDFVEGS